MPTHNPTFQALQDLGAFARPQTQEQRNAQAAAAHAMLDATANAAGQYASDSIRMAAVSAVQEWVASDLEDGESLIDRLFAHMVGVADDNKDGEITDDEADVIELAYNAAADYLVAMGADESDVIALIEADDEEAASRIVELAKASIPADQDAAMADLDNFVFDAESSESVMDGVLDAVYKKKVVVRNGRKMRVMKRVSGRVRLSAAQKVGIRKAQRKSNTAAARLSRMKSMKIRRRAGL